MDINSLHVYQQLFSVDDLMSQNAQKYFFEDPTTAPLREDQYSYMISESNNEVAQPDVDIYVTGSPNENSQNNATLEMTFDPNICQDELINIDSWDPTILIDDFSEDILLSIYTEHVSAVIKPDGSESDSESEQDETYFEIDVKDFLINDPKLCRLRSPLLYEFLIILLEKTKYHRYAAYVNADEGVFKIKRPNKVAQLWELVKNRHSQQPMNYDKFARAIRWYYRQGIFVKTNSRHTFKFSKETLRKYCVDDSGQTTSIPHVKQYR